MLLVTATLLAHTSVASAMSSCGDAIDVLDLASQADSREHAVQLRAALLSVHAHVDGRLSDLAALLEHVRPVPIGKVVDILMGEHGAMARSRQRRAGIRFLTLALSRVTPDDVREKAREAAVRLLSASEVQHVVDVLSPPLAGGCQAVSDESEAMVGALVEPTTIGACSWAKPQPRVSLNRNAININVDLLVKGQRISDAAKGLDPQQWHPCTSLWSKTHLCKMKDDGTPEKDDEGGCVPDTSVVFGSDYGGWRRMYEHFTCDKNLCSLKLFLDARVTFAGGQTDKYSLWYANPEMISGPKVDPDHGEVTMMADANGDLDIRSRKTFGFDDYASSAVMYLILSNIETGHYLGELACCHQ